MSTLTLRIIENDTRPVMCEFDSLNKMMDDAYLRTILKQAVAYNILVDDVVVGGCMIQYTRIVDDEFDVNGDNCFPAFEIPYLVIRKDMRGYGIGSRVLAILIQRIKRLSSQYPVRYLILEAFQNLEFWYTKYGFLKYDRNNARYPHTVSISMCMDLINRDIVEEYAEQLQ